MVRKLYQLAAGCCLVSAMGCFYSATVSADDWDQWRIANAAEETARATEDVAYELRWRRMFPDNSCRHDDDGLSGGYHGGGYYGTVYGAVYGAVATGTVSLGNRTGPSKTPPGKKRRGPGHDLSKPSVTIIIMAPYQHRQTPRGLVPVVNKIRQLTQATPPHRPPRARHVGEADSSVKR